MQIGDGDGRVVERRADVGDAFGIDDALRLLRGSHLLGHLLLAGNCATWALLRAGVGMSTLTAHGKTATVSRAAIRSDIHQTLDIHRRLGAKCTFDAVIALDFLSELVDIRVVEITDALRRIYPGSGENPQRHGAADSEKCR